MSSEPIEYYPYDQKEIDYLCHRDTQMAGLIERVGMIHKRILPDIFSGIIYTIIGQQVSTRVQETIWQRIQETIPDITPTTIIEHSSDTLRACGISYKKVDYIRGIAQQIITGSLDIEALQTISDTQIIESLCQLDGIGVWSAEMILIFSLQRPDVLSYGDLGIRRGLCNLYHLKSLSSTRFAKYKQLFSPYGTVASLYLCSVNPSTRKYTTYWGEEMM